MNTFFRTEQEMLATSILASALFLPRATRFRVAAEESLLTAPSANAETCRLSRVIATLRRSRPGFHPTGGMVLADSSQRAAWLLEEL